MMDSLSGSCMIWKVLETKLSNLSNRIKNDQEIEETLSALMNSIVEATITAVAYPKRHRHGGKGKFPSWSFSQTDSYYNKILALVIYQEAKSLERFKETILEYCNCPRLGKEQP